MTSCLAACELTARFKPSGLSLAWFLCICCSAQTSLTAVGAVCLLGRRLCASRALISFAGIRLA
jgi:hypothetical protein